jgi:hypothetical protein
MAARFEGCGKRSAYAGYSLCSILGVTGYIYRHRKVAAIIIAVSLSSPDP